MKTRSMCSSQRSYAFTRAWSLGATLCFVAGVASAHVTVDPQQGVANTYFKATFRVPHGCKGSPTVKLRVRMPEGVTSVKPQVHPPWKVEIKRVKLAQPQDNGHGGAITDAVSELAWSGGRIVDENFDEFAVIMHLPDRPGTTLYFPVVQECESGLTRWIEIPDAARPQADLPAPAPAVRLLPAK